MTVDKLTEHEEPRKMRNESSDGRRQQHESGRRLTREDFQDLAKIGGDLLKRTVSSSFDAIKEVTEGLPKEASQFLAKGKDEVMKGLSKEFAQSMVAFAVDKVFSSIRQHKLEVSIRIRRVDDADVPASSGKNSRREEKREKESRRPRHSSSEEE
jgi:hypothetical protein